MTDRIRSLRAVVFAALGVALAATAHVAMAGSGVSGPVLAGAFAFVLLPSWLLAGKRRGFALIGGWMAVAQFGLHQLFERAAGSGGRSGALAGPDWAALLLCNPDRAPAGLDPAELARTAGLDPTAATVGGLPPLGGAHHLGHRTVGHRMAGDGMSGMSGHSMAGHDVAGHGMSPGMLAAHLLAALACALLLWHSEAVLSRLHELLGAFATVVADALFALLVLLPALPYGRRTPATARPRERRTRLPRLVLLGHALVRRGPPAAFAV